MYLKESIQLLPEVFVLDGLVRRGSPVVILPPLEPPRDAQDHVLAVGYQSNPTGLLEPAEALYCSRQFSLLVGTVVDASRELLDDVFLLGDRIAREDGCPSTSSRISFTASVAENSDVSH